MEDLLEALEVPALFVDKSLSSFKENALAKELSIEDYSKLKSHFEEALDNGQTSFLFFLKEKGYIVEIVKTKKGWLLLLKDKEELLPELYFQVFETLPCFVIATEGDKITYLNSYTQDLLERSLEELKGKCICMVLSSLDEKRKVEEWRRRLFEGKEKRILTFLTKSGELKVILATPIYLSFRGKEILVIAGLDVTFVSELRKRVEELYKRQDFLQFLRNTIHDFNNLLKVVLDYLEKLRDIDPASKELKGIIEHCKKTITSWMEVNRTFLTSKEQPGVLQQEAETELVEFLKQNLELFQLVAGQKVIILCDFDYISAVWIPGDEFMWRYIFLNLISNARDAIEEKGRVEIVLRILNHRDTERLLIKVSDTGKGIPASLVEKIFQPFFSTKHGSTGLGLFLLKNYVEGIGGSVEVESKEGQGTSFKLIVPINRVRRLFSEKCFRKRILLIEDEDLIRESIAEALRCKGYEVIAFKSYKDLKSAIDSLPEVHLLITDYHLPEVSGKEVYQRLKSKFPRAEVLFLTGDVFGIEDLPSHRLLLKPFKLEDLLKKIKELI